jgi:hypothetical protein
MRIRRYDRSDGHEDPKPLSPEPGWASTRAGVRHDPYASHTIGDDRSDEVVTASGRS